ncbi:hypothetical protein C0993_002755 [Termitomyces sp. T159_Od127]|nr:hypothetical protein C0993_002755 [Termitomyces sp. T159_Od127]
MSKGKGLERTWTRSLVATEDLAQKLILRKDEAKERRRLLCTALDKLEAMQKRAVAAEEARNSEVARGMQIAQSTLGIQEQVTKARQDAEMYRLELEKKQNEIQRQQELMRAIEAERDLAEKEAAKAREVARQLNDERLVALARQEGRKLGFREGMTQGRKIAVAGRNRTSSPALVKEFYDEPRNLHARPSTPPAVVARRKQEAANAARKEQEAARKEQAAIDAARKAQEAAEVARKEQEAARKQFEAVEAARKQFEAIEAARRELEAAKRAVEEQVRKEAEERERRRQKEEFEAERQREVVRAAEREHEQRRVSEKEAELEREKEALRQREAARVLEIEAIMKRQEEKEKELEAERERERQVREERENELARERVKVRELEIEREASSTSSASHRSQTKRLEYLPMPEPPPFRNPRPGANTSKPSTPAGTQSPLPLHIPPPNFRQAQQFQPNDANPRARSHIRRTSQSSQETSISGSGSTSLNNLDIVSFPVIPRSHLSDIPEVASDIGRSPAQSVGPGQGNEQSPVDTQGGQMRPVQTRRMEDVEKWVQSTAASEVGHFWLNTPTEPATPPMLQPLTWPNLSPHGSNGQPGSMSSGTIPIEIQPPSRPTSLVSPTNEDVMFLSPNSRPLQLRPNHQSQTQAQAPSPQQPTPRSPYQYQRRLESEQPGFVPVIPDVLDGDDGIPRLMNFGTPGFIPVSITRTNTSEGSSRSTAESERRDKGRRAAEGATGSRIYRPSAPSSSTTSGPRSLYSQPQAQTPRMQIYAVPAQSSSSSASQRQSQTPRQTPRQIYSSMSASGSVGPQSNIYGPPQSSSRTSNIYAPPASGAGPQPTPDTVISTGTGPISSISGIPAVIPSSPLQPAARYGPPASPRTMPIKLIPPPSSQFTLSLQIPASGSDPSVPMIPPPLQHQIYNPNTNGPVMPSSSANGSPYPVSSSSHSRVATGIDGDTSTLYVSLPDVGVHTRTPGRSVAPLPTNAGRISAASTPRSSTGVLPRGSATPRARLITLDEDEDEDEEDDHDMLTRLNTEANRSGRGGMMLQVTPL